MPTNVENNIVKLWISGKQTRTGLFLKKPKKNVAVNILTGMKKVGHEKMFLTSEGLHYQNELLLPENVRSIKLIKYPDTSNIDITVLEIKFISDPEIMFILDTDITPKARKAERISDLYQKFIEFVPPESLKQRDSSKLRNIAGLIAINAIVFLFFIYIRLI